VEQRQSNEEMWLDDITQICEAWLSKQGYSKTARSSFQLNKKGATEAAPFLIQAT
jgi:hypothetical protein